MLTKAVRQELKDRGLDSIGKPWAVRERLDQGVHAVGVPRERAVDGEGGGARTRKLSEARAKCVDGERRRAGV